MSNAVATINLEKLISLSVPSARSDHVAFIIEQECSTGTDLSRQSVKSTQIAWIANVSGGAAQVTGFAS